MKATFQGFINVDTNAVFSMTGMYKGFPIGVKHYELKDGINADQFVIGQEYEIDNLVKAA